MRGRLSEVLQRSCMQSIVTQTPCYSKCLVLFDILQISEWLLLCYTVYDKLIQMLNSLMFHGENNKTLWKLISALQYKSKIDNCDYLVHISDFLSQCCEI